MTNDPQVRELTPELAAQRQKLVDELEAARRYYSEKYNSDVAELLIVGGHDDEHYAAQMDIDRAEKALADFDKANGLK